MANHSPRTPAQSQDYQHAFEAGRKRAAKWFAQHRYSLAVYRDLNRAEYANTQQLPETSEAILTGFDAGFDAGLARLISGADHV